MALIGTHIRFALEVKDDFGIRNMDKYISGTVYPDSRYLTKIERNVTHCLDVYNKDFCGEDDFRKGWMAHLIYDRIQAEVFEDIFEELFFDFKDEKLIWSEENWILKTSLKIIQDLDDISKFPIKQYLNSLNYIETPNNEKNELMKEYNQMFIDIYQNEKVTIQDLINMWVKFEVKKELTDLIAEKTHQMILDKNIFEKIPLIYPETIKRCREIIKK